VIQTDIFQKVAEDLGRVGVAMEIQMILNSKFLENAQTGKWRGTAAALPYFSPTFDPLYVMGSQVCTAPVPWFCDREITAAVAAARIAPTLEERRTQTERIMAMGHDAALGIFLYDSATFVGLGARVANYRQDIGFIRYEDIRLKR
jgi:ABC-type transport system substrate-binding protein